MLASLVLRAALAATTRRVLPALLLPWAAGLAFLVNFGPILDWAHLARLLADSAVLLRTLPALGWLAGWAFFPRHAVARALDGDLAFLQRAPLGPWRRGLWLGAALVLPAAVAALPGALWPGRVDAWLGFAAGELVALVAFARRRPAVGLAACAAGVLLPGWFVAAPAVWAVGRLAAAPAPAAASVSPGWRWTPRGPLGALLYRELLVLTRGELGAVGLAAAFAIPVGLLFQGFRRSGFGTEAELGQAAALAVVGAGGVAGVLAGRLVLRLGWPPVPRAWPVRAGARLVSLGVVVAACLVPTSLAFASAGVPGTPAAGVPVVVAVAATVAATPAAAMFSRGRQLGALLGWTALAVVLVLVGGGGALGVLGGAAVAFVWAGIRAAERP